MIELLTCNLETFWGEPAGSGSGDVVSYVVFNGLFCVAGFSHSRKFGKKLLEGILWFPGEKCRAERRHLGADTLNCHTGDCIGETVASHVNQKIVPTKKIST